jgi:hypothetical protein
MCHIGIMELEPHIETVREQLALAAEAGGEEASAVAQRLTAPLESTLRLMLLDVLTAAAAEITRELAPGSVELRLRTGAPEFVVSAPSIDLEQGGMEQAEHPQALRGGTADSPLGAGEGGVARVNLRLPDQLKSRVEQAADREGLSVNAWLVRAAAAAVQRAESGPSQEPHTPRGGQRYSGWGR